ncbi:MAG: hypothetical protein AMXMBFR20_30480 [Planctomycetia bacterium]|jgi:predicted MPP superfamily phosphohydrolase|nr:MAG: hypothetical protein B6D36_09565 [Planctomycetes bacterium UTPLA1]
MMSDTPPATQNFPLSRRPSDRFYSRLQWLMLGLLALLILYSFVLLPHYPVSRPVGFRLVIFSLVCLNGLWWSVADRRFARFIRSAGASRFLRLGTAGFGIALNIPIAYMLIAGRMPQFIRSPTWYAGAVTLWHLGLAFCLPIVAGLRLFVLAVEGVWRRVRSTNPSPTQPQDRQSTDAVSNDAELLTRRKLLKTAFATAPVLLLTGATAYGRAEEGELLIRRHKLPAPWLPDRLRGLTITHVSDLHVGRLYRPYLLPRLVDVVNGLDSDIVLVTGDIIDNSNDMLPAAVSAIGQFRHRHGLFVCIGNHDEIDDRAAFIRYTRDQLPLLINERRSIEIGGERITIAGLDYSSSPQPRGRRLGDVAAAEEMLLGHRVEREGPVIALAHHPHAFDTMAPLGVPLTLSGHTHGGQIMLTPPGMRPDLGLGQILFHYIRGFYRQGASDLFVNSGVGNWFPLRIQAPAEVVQIQLV